MDIVKGVQALFPEERRVMRIRYSGRFAAYNGNVVYSPAELVFSLARQWEEVSVEIQVGLCQHLLNKVLGERRASTEQDLYASFMKHLSKFAPIQDKEPYLLSRFRHINENFFNGLMTEPNIVWGQQALRKLGHYEYAADRIVISSVFRNAPFDQKVQGLLDFVVYHEMLHKKHSYDHKLRRAQHHSRAFREDEQRWPDKDVERKLTWFLRRKKLSRAFLGF